MDYDKLEIEAVFKDEMIEVRVWQGKNVKRKLN